MSDPKKQPGLKLNQILLEEASFSHAEDWLTREVPVDGLPELPLTVGMRFGRAADGTGALVGIQVSTIADEVRPPRYNIRVAVVGIVEVDDEPNLEPDEYALTAGASLLYPFLREIVANLTMRGRFGPIWLKPFNMKLAVHEILHAARSGSGATALGLPSRAHGPQKD